MGDQGKRSELQNRIAAELREKMAQEADDSGGPAKPVEDLPDHVEDSAYLKTYKKSKPIPRQVIILIVAAVVCVICGLIIALAR